MVKTIDFLPAHFFHTTQHRYSKYKVITWKINNEWWSIFFFFFSGGKSYFPLHVLNCVCEHSFAGWEKIVGAPPSYQPKNTMRHEHEILYKNQRIQKFNEPFFSASENRVDWVIKNAIPIFLLHVAGGLWKIAISNMLWLMFSALFTGAGTHTHIFHSLSHFYSFARFRVVNFYSPVERVSKSFFCLSISIQQYLHPHHFSVMYRKHITYNVTL